MSGLEVLGAISSIIAIVEGSIRIYNTVAKEMYLSPAIHQAAGQLPLVQDTLATAINSLSKQSWSPSANDALGRLLNSCEIKATKMDRVLSRLVLPEKTGRWKRVGLALNRSRDREVEELMSGILADLQVLVTNYVVTSTDRRQTEIPLTTALLCQGQENRNAGHRLALNNMGLGLQIAHTQAGNVNLNVGTGTQANINGSSNCTFLF